MMHTMDKENNHLGFSLEYCFCFRVSLHQVIAITSNTYLFLRELQIFMNYFKEILNTEL